MMALPFEGSGLKDTDFKKLLDLMRKMREDSRRPLTLASAPVWEHLHQLRGDVADILKRRSNEDEANVKALLMEIDAVFVLSPQST
jgi:hypothetical protein